MVKQRETLKVGGKSNTIVDLLMKQTVQWGDFFERASLKAGQELFSAGRRTQFVYAPIEAVVSITASTGGVQSNGKPQPNVTLNMLGSGDLVGVSQLLGDATLPYGAICDMGGAALRCSTQAARRFLDEHESSRHVVQAYANLQAAESWQWLVASVQLPVPSRIAAYLLLSATAAGTDALPVTHRMMASRTAIRQPSITEILQTFVNDGLIKQLDGRIDILDEQRLKDMVHEVWPLFGTHRQAFLAAW